MYMHHKNMKYLCNATEAWERKHLGYLGIVKLCCNFMDLEHNTYLPLGSGYTQYCEFLEKKLHYDIAARITPGIRHCSPNEVLYQVVESHYLHKTNADDSHQKLHAIDWTIRTETGFEVFLIVSHQPIQPHQMSDLKHWLHAFSYKGAQVKKYKPKALLEIENRDAIMDKYLNFEAQSTEMPVEFQKAKFGTLVLTGKEQAYIQHLMLHRPYQEIAAYFQISEMAVHKSIQNIKRKLGSANMSMPDMFSQLNECGVLESCLQSIQSF